MAYGSGSLVIPMDTDTTLNHTAYNQNNGMWKAYGLLYRLLDNGVPVSWAINTSKTTTSTTDFTVSSVKDLQDEYRSRRLGLQGRRLRDRLGLRDPGQITDHRLVGPELEPA